MPKQVRFSFSKKSKLYHDINDLYFIKRWKVKDIAESLDISMMSVNRMLSELRESRKKGVEKNEGDYYSTFSWVADVDESTKEVIRRAWNEFNLATNRKERLQCMDRVLEAEKMRYTLFQSMGLIPKAQEKDSTSERIVYKSNLKGGEVTVEEKVVETVRETAPAPEPPKEESK